MQGKLERPKTFPKGTVDYYYYIFLGGLEWRLIEACSNQIDHSTYTLNLGTYKTNPIVVVFIELVVQKLPHTTDRPH